MNGLFIPSEEDGAPPYRIRMFNGLYFILKRDDSIKCPDDPTKKAYVIQPPGYRNYSEVVARVRELNFGERFKNKNL